MGFDPVGINHLNAPPGYVACCICPPYEGDGDPGTNPGCPIHQNPIHVHQSDNFSPQHEQMNQFDVINKAKHYNSHPSGVEAIDICRHMTGDWFNVFKYVFRADHKNGRQDIEKALYYAKDGIRYCIPMRLPSWSLNQDMALARVIASEQRGNPHDEQTHRYGFFWAIAEEDSEAAFHHIKHLLDGMPE